MFFRITVKSDGRMIAKKALLADSFFKRFKGLMFGEKMEGYDALVLKPCNSIHTFFMQYSIDVIFLDKELRIIKIKRNLQPWRITPMYFSSNQVVEFVGGHLDRNLKKGDELEVVCIS